ncbi:HAD family hydrolase [Endozoicomonas sp. ALD040]|uniref:HAD family hydrolase n=1 Tax=Endozoicomonas sp. ALD040 TaxID=3403079 RepID=UPI003BB14D7F
MLSYANDKEVIVVPFSPLSFLDFYKSNKDVQGKYPILDNGRLSSEKVGWVLGPSDKYNAFCRSVSIYYQRHNELMDKPELVGVSREVRTATGARTPLLKRDVSITDPATPRKASVWNDECVALNQASLTVLHEAEVELVQLLLKKAPDNEIVAAVENLISKFCLTTKARDKDDWESHLKDFMESEKVDIRIQCAKHRAPDEEKPYRVTLLQSTTDTTRKNVFTSRHTGDLDQYFYVMDQAIDYFKTNPPRELRCTRRERANARRSDALDTQRLSAITPPQIREKLVHRACQIFVDILGDRQYSLTVQDMKQAYRDKVMTDEMVNACLDNMKFNDPLLNELGRTVNEGKFLYGVLPAEDVQAASEAASKTVEDDNAIPVFTSLEKFYSYLRQSSAKPHDISDELDDDYRQMGFSPLGEEFVGPQQPATREQLEAFKKARAFNPDIKDADLAVAIHLLNTDERLARGVLNRSPRQQDYIREFSGKIVVTAKKVIATTDGASVVPQTVTIPPPVSEKQPEASAANTMPSEQSSWQLPEMDDAQQQFLTMKAQWDRIQPSGQQPDRVVSGRFNQHRVHAVSFEDAVRDLEKERRQMLINVQPNTEAEAFNQIKEDIDRGYNRSKIDLEYQYGRIDKDEATRQITAGTFGADRVNRLADLDKLTIHRQTLISADEEVEFELLNNVVSELYKRQAAGNSNCQGFANSLEHFARGKGYNQVHAISTPIEIPFDNSETTPIVGWAQIDGIEEKQHHHQFQNHVGEFFEAIKKGQQRQPGAAKRPLAEAFDSDRYVVLKSGESGGAGHYTFLQRLKSSGRFIVVDAQNRQMFPVLNPDGTPTDEARDYFNTVSVQAYSPEFVTDEQYDREIDSTNLCLASDRNYGHLIGVFEQLDKVPEQWQVSIEAAADWLSSHVNGAPARVEIIKGLERAPGRELWPSLWDGTYQLRRPAEVEPLKHRFDAFDPNKGRESCRDLIKNLVLLSPEQRSSRRTAYEAFQQLRGRYIQIDQAMRDVQETNFNAAFPTEREWNEYCGPDVDMRLQANIDKAEQQVINAQPISKSTAMKQLMDDLWKLSPAASQSRKQAAEELVQIRPELQLSPAEVEANLSRCFSEAGWDFLWGGLNLKRSQLISLQMKMDQAQVSRAEDMKALMHEMLRLSDPAANNIELASQELAQIRPDLGLDPLEIERNLKQVFPDNDWKTENRALRGRAKEVKDDIKLNLMGRGRQVMTWGQNELPAAQAVTVPPGEVTVPEAASALPEALKVRESVRVPKSQDIREVLAHIKPGEPVLVCFDLDETLIAKDLVAEGRQERRLVNPDTAKIIQDIRTKAGPGNARIILLTANDEDSLRKKIEETQLDRNLFDDAISIKIQTGPLKTKEQGLHHYLDKSGHPAQHIVMVDDLQDMLKSVEKAADDRGIPYTTFHFYGAKPMIYRVDFAADREMFTSGDGRGPDISFERFIELQELADDNGWNSGDLTAIYINESPSMRDMIDGQREFNPSFDWRDYKLPTGYQPPAHLGKPVINYQ